MFQHISLDAINPPSLRSCLIRDVTLARCSSVGSGLRDSAHDNGVMGVEGAEPRRALPDLRKNWDIIPRQREREFSLKKLYVG
jgi:hypothetical protein